MGWKRTRHTFRRTWTPQAGVLTPGDYVARLHAVDRAGRTLRRTATASGRSRLTVIAPPPPPCPRPGRAGRHRHGRLPRPRRLHLGRPRSAPCAARPRTAARTSSPPRARRSPRRARASCRGAPTRLSGAGNYVVVHADDGRDFVFMHLQNGSITRDQGRRAQRRPGLRPRPASTGHSTGPHLHFEIWPDGWYASDASAADRPRART